MLRPFEKTGRDSWACRLAGRPQIPETSINSLLPLLSTDLEPHDHTGEEQERQDDFANSRFVNQAKQFEEPGSEHHRSKSHHKKFSVFGGGTSTPVGMVLRQAARRHVEVALIWIKRISPPMPQALSVTIRTIAREVNMADTSKLSVEKALNKIREADARKAKTDKVDEEIDALNEETKRLREQRVRLERHQRRSTKRD
jgi:hypothetical protein